MNTNANKLALRRQSIRTLTADELRFARGGQGDGTGNGPGHTTKHTTVPTTGQTRHPTLTKTDLPPQTQTVA
jgi:hypothetical protein